MAEDDKKIEEQAEEDKVDNTPPSDETDNKENPESKDSEKIDDTDDSEGEGKDTNEKEDGKPSEDIDYSQKDESEVADALKGVGFNYDSLCQEYATTGGISEKTRAELAKVGITGTIVDNYIAGMLAKAQQDYNEVAEVVGGREKFDEIIDWAAHNLDPEEIRSINAVTDKFQVKSILRDLKVRMEDKEGKTPDYQKGSGDKPSVEMFNSQAEMFDAIKDPKYKKDEHYRSVVQKKIAASREAGVDLGIY